ncbi:MAG: helix-turn-helix domain-containing protein [Leadbetterella sp.]
MSAIYEIKEFHQARSILGFHPAINNDFDIYRLETINKNHHLNTPLYRQHFFDITLFENTKFDYLYGGKTFQVCNYTLQLNAPFQISQVICNKGDLQDLNGYTCNFTHDFISTGINRSNFLKDFPFFKLNSTNNIIPLNEKQVAVILPLFEKLQYENDNQDQIIKSREIIQSYLWILLNECLRIYSQLELKPESQTSTRPIQIADDFQEMVEVNYQKLSLVDDYAKLLCISTNHLTQTIKQCTGKSPKTFINERRISEAKCLLQYSQMTVAQISDTLSFYEPTHFIKFFKVETGETPLRYRHSFNTNLQ